MALNLFSMSMMTRALFLLMISNAGWGKRSQGMQTFSKSSESQMRFDDSEVEPNIEAWSQKTMQEQFAKKQLIEPKSIARIEYELPSKDLGESPTIRIAASGFRQDNRKPISIFHSYSLSSSKKVGPDVHNSTMRSRKFRKLKVKSNRMVVTALPPQHHMNSAAETATSSPR